MEHNLLIILIHLNTLNCKKNDFQSYGSKRHVYPRTPYSSEGLIPIVIICCMGIDPYVLFLQHQE